MPNPIEVTEYLSISDRGRLQLEDVDLIELADEFGTPLYATSENQIRQNYRRFAKAFTNLYPDTTILFANKSNSNLAVRRILTQEGAGGDCFGLGELTLSLLAGVPPEKLVMNGSNKSIEELRAAIQAGVAINIDHPDELEPVNRLAGEIGAQATINLRVLPYSYADLSQLTEPYLSIARDKSHDKWGMDKPTVREIAPRALTLPNVKLQGLHCHVSRLGPTTEHFELAAKLMVAIIADLRDREGWQPEVLDIGGGYAHERDPESGRDPDDHRVATPEEYAAAVINPLREELARYGLKEPHLHLEPGRRLVSNSTVLLGRVGIIKTHPSTGVTWLNVDASTNHCLRALISGYRYHVVNVNRPDAPMAMRVNITGPNCTMDLIGGDRELPATERGDLLAILDVGGYAEMVANQFNLIPRPATVLVNGSQVDVIRRRETIQDLLLTQQVPARLLVDAPVTNVAVSSPT